MNCGFINSIRAIRFGSVLLAIALGASRAHGGGSSINSLTPLTNLVVCPCDNATFSTKASGQTPYQFQWYKGSTALPGKTNSSLTLTNVGAADVGTYSVKLIGGHNSVTNSATLAVKTPVSITPLTDLVRSVGANAVFTTVASGTPPFTYVWKKNGADIPNQTGSSLTLSNLKTNDSATYTVEVTGACGSSATSSACLLVDTCFPAVDVALVIDRSGSMAGKPYDDARLACSNFVHNLNYAANADQAALASYNSAATLDRKLTNNMQVLEQAIGSIPAANGNTSISLGLQTGQAELMSSRHRAQSLPVLVLLSDGLPTGGDTISNALYNATQAKNAGTRIFTVGLGAVDHALMGGIASSTNDYFYTTNSAQLGALFNAISTIICRPPTNIFVSGLSNLTLCPGLTANFNVTASGCAPFSYRWNKDGVTLAGQTNSSLVIPNVSATNGGTYSVEVTGECKTVTNSATLTVNAPVLISTPLSNQTNCPGTTAIFNVGATGTGLSYQWYKGVAALNGQTGNSLVLTNVNAASTGTYSVVIVGACGNPMTNSANLVLNSPVTIVTPPSNQIACPSGTATFSVSANGTGLSYRWLQGGNILTGRTNGSLTLSGIIPADQGIYSVIVSGTCNSVTNSATLTVNTPVSATPLASQTNCPGSTVIFSTTASGTGPFGYAWFKNGNLIGGSSSSLVLSNVSAASGGTYSVIVSGACGAVTNAAALSVNTPLSAVGPVSQTNCPGTIATFNTVASGTGPFSYQWSRGALVLNGQTNSTLTLTGITQSNAAVYQVVVSGACGSVTNSATLAVNTSLTSAFLFSETNCPGSTAVFSATPYGTGPFSYVWSKDGYLLGENGNLLTIPDLTANDAGTYSVVITGACGSVTNSGHLTVSTPVSATPLVSQTNCPGSTVIFSTTASGTAPFGYAWFKNGNLIGGSSSSLVLSNVSAGSIGTYSVIVSGSCGSVTNTATLALNTPVSAVGPVSQTNCPGTIAIFNTVASGTGPFSYQWYRGSLVLGGETNSTLMLSDITQSNAATYQVVVAGACGSVTNSATLTVNTLVRSEILFTKNGCPGGTAEFSVNPSGTGPFTYVWRKDGQLLGETGSLLTLTNLTANDEGTYSVLITGACNSSRNSGHLTMSTPVSATPLLSQTNCPGSTVIFSTTASGSGPFGYAWLKDGNLIEGEFGSSLVLSNVSAGSIGTYSVVVSGPCDGVTNFATLALNTPVSAVGPVNQTNCPGTIANFNAVASGTGPFGYQWYRDSVALVGETNSSLSLSGVAQSNAAVYQVVVSGVCGSVTNSAWLNVRMVIAATPLTSLTNCPGTMAVFSTDVSGTGPYSAQWFKDGNPLDGETGLSLVLTNVTAVTQGVYSIVVNGPCNSVTNSASLNINSVVSAVGPFDQTNCPGSMVVFSTVASGTGPFSYQWFKNNILLFGETKANLTLTNVSPSDAAVYQVIVSGACQSLTNSASLSLYETTTAAAMAILVRNVGESATFSVSASGTGPFTYVWKKDNAVIRGQTGSSLTLSNISFADDGTYAVEVTGMCNTAVESAALHVNIPPTISIFSPTNGTSFVIPANFTLAANADDIDGSVTNVEFFEGTNKLGETTIGNPFINLLTNVAIGSHTYTARATDNNGATGVSLPISIQVLNSLPLSVITATHFNPQTGLYEQKVRVTNPTYSPFEAVRVYISGLQAGVNVYNASGTTNGLPYVQSSGGVQPGSYVDLIIEYHVTVGGVVPNPILFAERVPIPSGGSSTVIGNGQHINRAFRTPDQGFLVEFLSVSNRIYRVQYSRDLKNWMTVPTPVAGNGTWIQWVDNGEPKTESAPLATDVRFYRVIVLP